MSQLVTGEAVALDLRAAALPSRVVAGLLDGLLLDSGGETVLERSFLRLMREADLPRPRTQVVQRHDDVHVARVDFLFEAERIVVELRDRMGAAGPADTPSAQPWRAQVHEALVGLGWSAKDADAAIERVAPEVGADADVSTILRDALRTMARR